MTFWKFFYFSISPFSTIQEEPFWPVVFSFLSDTGFSEQNNEQLVLIGNSEGISLNTLLHFFSWKG